MMTMVIMNGNTVNGINLSKTGCSAFSSKLAAFFRGCLRHSTETRGFCPVNETEELFHRARCMGWSAASSISSRLVC